MVKVTGLHPVFQKFSIGFWLNKVKFSTMAPKNPFKSTLIAPCGMDCAICMAFLRDRNTCNGCYSPDRKCRKGCSLSDCEHIRRKYHHTCEKFPCRHLSDLDKRYRTRYGMSMVENLKTIKEHGIREFVRTERERWTCKACGGTINVHHGKCADCGKDR